MSHLSSLKTFLFLVCLLQFGWSVSAAVSPSSKNQTLSQNKVLRSSTKAECYKLMKSLKEYKKAQQSLLDSSLSSQEVMFENYQSQGQSLEMSSGQSFRSVVKKNKLQTESFKKRIKSQRELQKKFLAQSESYLLKIEQCLSVLR